MVKRDLINRKTFGDKFSATIYSKLQNDYLQSSANDDLKAVAEFVTTEIMCTFHQLLDAEPLIEDFERPKGAWITKEDNTSFVHNLPRRWVECPICGWSFSYDRIKDKFCSWCGADMQEGNGETNN